MASDYFLCGRITYELLSKKWGNIYTGPYMSRMNSIPKLVASRTLKEPLTWNAKLIKGDVVEEIESRSSDAKNYQVEKEVIFEGITSNAS